MAINNGRPSGLRVLHHAHLQIFRLQTVFLRIGGTATLPPSVRVLNYTAVMGFPRLSDGQLADKTLFLDTCQKMRRHVWGVVPARDLNTD